MEWRKKDTCKSIKEVVDRNIGKEIEIPETPPYIKGLKEAVELTKKCVSEGMPITIVGDYDCDGITSSSILTFGLWEYTGVKPMCHIPKRFTEGYGINEGIINKIPNGLMITVDNGISAVDQIKKAKEKGLTVIILDHHKRRDDGLIPEADVVVDPCAIEGSEFEDYCGAGIAYRFIMELIPESKFAEELITLAGIGTVADVMRLVGDNRRLVNKAVENVVARKVPYSLNLLLEKMGVSEHCTEQDFGFKLGPLCNAAGRLQDDGGQRVYNYISSKAAKTLLEKDTMLTEADNLIQMNEERKKLVKEQMDIVNELMRDKDKSPVIVLYDNRFSVGLVGILAGKLAEKYNVPAFVFTDSFKALDVITGSGRCPEALNCKEMLDNVSDLLAGYGGHAGAAGLSMKRDNIKQFETALKQNLSDYTPQSQELKEYDLEISLDDVPEALEEMEKYAPFGAGNPQIIFRINEFSGVPKVIGKLKNHFKLEGVGLTALGFDLADTWKQEGEPTNIDILGTLSKDISQGEVRYQIEMEDFKKREVEKTETYNNLASLFNFT